MLGSEDPAVLGVEAFNLAIPCIAGYEVENAANGGRRLREQKAQEDHIENREGKEDVPEERTGPLHRRVREVENAEENESSESEKNTLLDI